MRVAAGFGAVLMFALCVDASASDCQRFVASIGQPLAMVVPTVPVLNVRRAPSEDAEAVAHAAKNQVLLVHEKCPGWYRIESDYWTGGETGQGDAVSYQGWVPQGQTKPFSRPDWSEPEWRSRWSPSATSTTGARSGRIRLTHLGKHRDAMMVEYHSIEVLNDTGEALRAPSLICNAYFRNELFSGGRSDWDGSLAAGEARVFTVEVHTGQYRTSHEVRCYLEGVSQARLEIDVERSELKLGIGQRPSGPER